MRYYEPDPGWIGRVVAPLIFTGLALLIPGLIKGMFFPDYEVSATTALIVVGGMYVYFFVRYHRDFANPDYIELLPGSINFVPAKKEKYPPAIIPVSNVQLIDIVSFAAGKQPSYYYLHTIDKKPTSIEYGEIPEFDMAAYCKRERIPLRKAIMHENYVDEVKLKTNHLTIVYYETIIADWQVTKKVKTKDIERIEHVVKHPLSYTDSYYKVYTPQQEPKVFSYYCVEHEALKEYAAKNMIHMVRVEEYGNPISY